MIRFPLHRPAPRWLSLGLVFLLALSAGIAGPARGQSPDDDIPYEALKSLVHNRPDSAVPLLEEAVQKYPNEARLYEFLGEARLRLDRYYPAWNALRRARGLGRDTPRLRFLTGSALLAIHRPYDALKHLEKAPDTVLTRLHRAEALLQLQRPREALELLEGLEPSDASERAHVRLLRGRALAMQGHVLEARRELEAGRESARGTPVYRHYDDFERRRFTAARPYGDRAALSAGHNDNVALLSEEATGLLSSELADQDDAQVEEHLSGWYRLSGDAVSGLVAYGNAAGVQYGDLGDFNEILLAGGLRRYAWTGPRTRLEGGLEFEYSRVGNEDYAYRGRAILRMIRVLSRRWQLQARYRFGYRDFKFPVLAQEDRDGALHELVVYPKWSGRVGGRSARLTPYLEYGLETTAGASSENRYWGFGLNGRLRLASGVEGFVNGGYRERHYDNPHIRTLFTFDRHDEYRTAGSGLHLRYSPSTYFTLRWEHVDNDSNIPVAFSFEQNQYLITATVTGP